jgi:peptidoglycan/xylan/chitin deacetylase (PgdA/CDA1 family)
MNFVAGSLWYVPCSFSIARVLGSRYSLRCVLFHDISDQESAFTRGLGGTTTREGFEAALRFITRFYTPVSFQEVLASFDGKPLPPRPVLVTFDDAYASISEFGAPLCSKLGVPAVFFVNAACIDNKQLALDNLVCYVANECGLKTVNDAIRLVNPAKDFEVRSLTEVFSHFLPRTALSARNEFKHALIELAGINERALAVETGLYLSSQQLRDLRKFNFEIGDHTYTHTNCRTLSKADFAKEIDQNKRELEAISGTNVRSFSVPYGSSVDLTIDISEHLRSAGYQAVFLAEGRANSRPASPLTLDRVSLKATTDAAFFSEIEILPRLRGMRNWILAASKSASVSRLPHSKKPLSTWHNAAGSDNGASAVTSNRNLGT